MITNKRGGTKYPRTGGTGENTPFAIQSRKKEQDNGHDRPTVAHIVSQELYTKHSVDDIGLHHNILLMGCS